MDEDKSTTPGNNPTDDTAGTTDSSASANTGTDNQPGSDANNLDDSSKSDDAKSTDGDKKSPEDSKDNDAPATPQLDEDLDDWAEKRGMPKAETEDQKRSYQELRNQQREYTRSQQANKSKADAEDFGKEVNKVTQENKGKDSEDDDDRDPIEKRQDKIEAEIAQERTTRQQTEFYTTNQVTEEQHKAMLDIFREEVATGDTVDEKKANLEYWSNPKRLPTLLKLANARLAEGADTTAIEEEAARKEREKIGRESNAKSPGRSATKYKPTDTSDINSDEARKKRWEERRLNKS